MIKTPYDDATVPTPGGAQMSGISGQAGHPADIPDAPAPSDYGEIGDPMEVYTIEGQTPGMQVDAGSIANTGKNRTLGTK